MPLGSVIGHKALTVSRANEHEHLRMTGNPTLIMVHQRPWGSLRLLVMWCCRVELIALL